MDDTLFIFCHAKAELKKILTANSEWKLDWCLIFHSQQSSTLLCADMIANWQHAGPFWTEVFLVLMGIESRWSKRFVLMIPIKSMNFLQVFVLQWLKQKRFHNQTTPASQPAASGNLENNLHTLCTAMSACEKGSWQTSLSLLRYLRGALSAPFGFVVSLALYCFFWVMTLSSDVFYRGIILFRWYWKKQCFLEKN